MAERAWGCGAATSRALLRARCAATPRSLPRPGPQTQFLHEEHICIPVGAAIGAVTGFLNERWRPGNGEDGGAGGGRGAGAPSAGSGGLGGPTAFGRSIFGFGAEPAGAYGAGAAAGGGPSDDFDPFRQHRDAKPKL